MTLSTPRLRAGRLTAAPLIALVFALSVAACGSSTTITASPSPSASTSTPSADLSTPSPAASPSEAPSASATPIGSPAASRAPSPSDPANGIAIAPPYQLSPLDPALETTFRQRFAESTGAFASLIGVGGRTIQTNGSLAGYLFVLSFPKGLLSDAAYQAMLNGLETSSQVTFAATTISGVKVSTGSTATSGLGVYHSGDKVIILMAPTASSLIPIATALISASH